MYSIKYGINNICFSPTVYEMLKRYQFTRQKTDKIAMMQTVNTRIRNHLEFDQRTLSMFEELPLQKDSIFREMPQLRQGDLPEDPVGQFLAQLNLFLQQSEANILPQVQNEFFKCFTLLTLRQLLVPLSLSIYSPEETDKINLAQSVIVNAVMKILDTQLRNIDKSKTPSVQADFMTDFLVTLAQNRENCLLQKLYKAEIIQMFNSDNFFLMSESTLKKWQQIMRNFMQANNELFDDLLLKFNKAEGLFNTKKYEFM